MFYDFLLKMKIEIVVLDKDVDDVIGIIVWYVRRGIFGDGKIFVFLVYDVVRIRIGERGEEVFY